MSFIVTSFTSIEGIALIIKSSVIESPETVQPVVLLVSNVKVIVVTPVLVSNVLGIVNEPLVAVIVTVARFAVLLFAPLKS